jgi:hypothetical protein
MVVGLDQIYPQMQMGELLAAHDPVSVFGAAFAAASAHTFARQG